MGNDYSVCINTSTFLGGDPFFSGYFDPFVRYEMDPRKCENCQKFKKRDGQRNCPTCIERLEMTK